MISFLQVSALPDVTELLWADGPTTLVIAGGTDVLVRPEPFAGKNLVVDVSRLDALRGIGLTEQGSIRIGAGVTHQEVADDQLIRRRARLLSLACRSVGSLQIRNRGTLGGNLGNASPAADSVPALVCLDARVRLVSRDRTRSVPVEEFFKGPGQTVMGCDEVIESVCLPPRKGRTVAIFKKAGQRRGMCCAKATVALVARRHGDGRLTDVRVAMGAVASTVIGVPRAVEALEDRVLDPELIQKAARACCDAARPIDDIRSTAEYRRAVVGALMTEGLSEVLDHIQSIERLAGRRRTRRRPGAKGRKRRK